MYLWIKVLHIVGFVSWFAGLFYIWRLFVYHSEASSVDVKKTLEVMEFKLYKYIMRVAATITIISGTWMLIMSWQVFKSQIWLHIKLLLVVLVFINHLLAEKYRKRLQAGEVFISRKFRIINEIPTLLLIGIVIMVMIKPF